MRRLTVLLCVICVSLACHSPAPSSGQWHELYKAHQWFELRAAAASHSTSVLESAAVAAAFNDAEQAEKQLRAVIATTPHSEDAYEALELLTYVFMLSGSYHRALEQDEAMLAARPDDASARNAYALLAALSHYPDQAVTQRRSSRVRYRLDDGNLFLPVSIGGKAATYMLDSGANFSTMSESEAKRHGLTIHDVGAKGQDATGGDVAFRLAVAEQVTVGEVKLANVAFLIIGDDQQPFAGSPQEERGILGLPVLLAMETVRWDQQGNFDLGFAGGAKNLSSANLCFDGADLVAEAFVQDRRVSLVLDTGASDTRLWPPFARNFPALIASVDKKDKTKVEGVAHTRSWSQ